MKRKLLANTRLVKALAALALVALIMSTVGSCLMFARSYRELSNAIQTERIDYIDEILGQIITSQRFMEREYSDLIQNYAGILENGEVSRFEDVSRLLCTKSSNNVLLMNTSGGIVNMDGDAVFLSSRKLVTALYGQTGVVRVFESLNNLDDYWVFACRIEPLSINSNEYDVLMLAVPSGEYRDNLAISLLDNRGASYIVRGDGSIALKPGGQHIAFSGYNIYTSLSRMGALEDDVSALRLAVTGNEPGNMLMEIGGEIWMIGYDFLDSEHAIIGAVPLSITAAGTYAGLTNTILFSALIVTLISLMALILVMYFFYRDKERNKKAIAAEARSDFLSKMSHDIRTPLNAIIGLQTLIEDSDDLAEMRGYAAQSASASSYLLSIINDVLEMSRIDSGKLVLRLEPFDLGALVNGISVIISGMASEKGIVFQCALDGAFDSMYLGDAVRIKQVLANLLNNAVKFTRSGGRIDLIVSRRPLNGAQDEITIVVRDTGIGMSKDFLTRIFTPFEQEHSSLTEQFSGSGLGLSIVNSLVSLMNGKISVISQPGEGTAFTVALPLERGERVREDKPEKTEAAKTYPGRRVLLAEDNQVNQQIMTAILSKKFEIAADIAPDGEKAVRMFAESGAGYYDMIFMDIKMPLMDGLEAAMRIRALDRADAGQVPIIALSANAFAEDVAKSMKAGMNGHLAKPLEIAALSAALNKFIANKEG